MLGWMWKAVLGAGCRGAPPSCTAGPAAIGTVTARFAEPFHAWLYYAIPNLWRPVLGFREFPAT